MAGRYGYTGGADTTFSEDLWFNGTALAADSWVGWTYQKDLSGSGGVGGLFYQKWAYVVCTYNVTTKLGTMYINGEKMKEQNFNLWPAGSKDTKCSGLKYGGALPDVKNDLAFGFIQSRAGTLWATESWGGYAQPGANHFKGLLDDVRTFNRALTSVEVGLMYNSEKP